MNHSTRFILLFAVVLWLFAGCGTVKEDLGGKVKSQTQAGVTSVDVQPVQADEGKTTIGTHYKADLGKEYDNFSFDAGFTCSLNEDGKLVPPCTPSSVNVQAGGVRAFQGQAIAADAVKELRKSLTERDIQVSDTVFQFMEEAIVKAIESYAPVPKLPGPAP